MSTQELSGAGQTEGSGGRMSIVRCVLNSPTAPSISPCKTRYLTQTTFGVLFLDKNNFYNHQLCYKAKSHISVCLYQYGFVEYNSSTCFVIWLKYFDDR